MKKTIKIVDYIRIIKIHISVFHVAFEDEPFAVLVGDQDNHLIAQLGQKSVGSVRQCELDDCCRRRGNKYRMNVVRFLETIADGLSSQVVSSCQKMM